MDFKSRYGPWGLIAGASEGLGAAFGRALAARGLNVILVARREAALADTAAAIRAQHSVEVVTAAVDLSAPHVMSSLAPWLAGRDVGLYVNNAAFVPRGEFLASPVDDHLKSVEVNCRIPLLLSHHLGPAMVARGRGGLILMSSLTAFQGTPLLSTYGATKAFNLTLAEGLHAELGPRGVDVLAVCAGATRTPGYLRSAGEGGAPGELEPSQVVEEALDQLGHRAFMIPGAFNRFASFLMRSLLPRTSTVKILANQARRLRLP